MTRIVIIGAGPAGIAAASVLVAHGHTPLLIDEARQPGGQVYRRATAPVRTNVRALLGAQAAGYHRAHAAFARIAGQVEYRAETLAWNVFGGEVHTLSGTRVEAHGFDRLLLATGATDRVLPVAGWTLPGVFTLGGAQALLKDQGCLIGRSTLFCGSSPLLYLAALQYLRAGGHVAAVLDSTPWRSKLMAARKLAAGPGVLARGLGWMAALRRRGVRIHQGVRLLRMEGADRVEGVGFRDAAGAERITGADAVAFGFGLRSETQLAEMAGCRLRFDPVFRQFLPETDADGRCGEGVYAAGDGCTIGGADAAECSGRLAAYAMLADLGVRLDTREVAPLRRRLARLRRFQEGLAAAFAWPHGWLADTEDAVMLCRCENVTLGEVRRALRADIAPGDVNRAKAFTRCGMGRCQGRFCGLTLAELMAAERRVPLAEMGWLRVQAPVKPLPLSALPVME